MAVIINELEHVPAPVESRSGGSGSGGDGGRAAPSAPSPAEMIRALHREASRRARLWAD